MLNVVALRSQMEASDVSRKELSKAWHVNQPSVSMKLSGERSMTLSEIIYIAKRLKLSKEEFVKIFGDCDNVKDAQSFRKFWAKI